MKTEKSNNKNIREVCKWPDKMCKCVDCCERRYEEAAERRYIALENEREFKGQIWDRMGA